MPLSSNLHLLVVEDSPVIRAVVTKMLLNLGYRVTAAEDGRTALRELEGLALPTPPPDLLILLDMTLPDINGPEFLAEMEQRGLKVPVIIVTAQDLAEYEGLQLEYSQVKVIMSKPFTLRELLEAVIKSRRKESLTD